MSDKQLHYAQHLLATQSISSDWYSNQPTHNNIYTNKEANYKDQIIIDGLRKLELSELSSLIGYLLDEDSMVFKILLIINNYKKGE